MHIEKIFRKYYLRLVIMCDQIIDAEAKSNDENTKTIPTNFN